MRVTSARANWSSPKCSPLSFHVEVVRIVISFVGIRGNYGTKDVPVEMLHNAMRAE
jgi:hypothetical protein